MEKLTPTASAIINFAGRLEDDSSEFYKEMAKRHEKGRETFLTFVKESTKNKILVTRTYQETISDALEACFSFEGLNLNNYLVETTLMEDTSYSNALKQAIELEERAYRFYLDVAERSKSFLATLPRAFRKVAKGRNNRKLRLKSLLDNQK